MYRPRIGARRITQIHLSKVAWIYFIRFTGSLELVARQVCVHGADLISGSKPGP